MDEVRLIVTRCREAEPECADRQAWAEALPKMLGSQAEGPAREEAAALLKERDPELFFGGLLILAGRQQKRGNLQVAATIYGRLAADSKAVPGQNFQPSPAVAELARHGLAALTGSGAFGRRSEFLLSQFTQQATDYRMIVPMMAASTLFNLTKAATLSRLAGSGAWFSRGAAARVMANLSGFALEVPTFSLLSRGLMDLSGEPVSWSTGAVAKDLAGATLTLGALKGFAYLGGRAYYKIHGRKEMGALSRIMIPQASAFTGMLLAHHAETELELRPKVEGASAVTDTLASLLSLGVGAQLGRRALGPRFGRWEAELGLRTQILSNSLPNLRGLSSQWAFAFPQTPTRIPGNSRAEADRRQRPLTMSAPEDKNSPEPFFISTGRIRGGSETQASATATAIPFRTLVHRNNLYGGRVLALAPQKPGQVYTLGAKNTVARQYKNLHQSERGKRDTTMVANRDGYLHHRQRVEDLAERTPDFINLFRNEGIRDKQASLEERNGTLFLRNLTRESLVWVLDGSKWQAASQLQELPLKDGSWIVLGKDPRVLPENTLDPRHHTVFRVELHRPQPLSPDRWNLIEFENLDPAQLEKIPTSVAYLAALLGQSPDFIAWRLRSLFKAIDEAGWKVPEVKDLVQRVFTDSPILAEMTIGMLAEVLSSAHRKGWSHPQLRELLFHEALAGKNGLAFLSRLPKLLEESSALQLKPTELSALLVRMAKYESQFPRSMETLPDFLREWQSASGEKPRLQALLDFLDQAGVSIEALRDLFPKTPGGEEVFLATMTRLIPEIQKNYEYRGGTLTELGAELLKRIAEKSPQAPAKEWVEGALSSLPTAFGQLFGHRFGFLEQREILFHLAGEQGLNFSEWWRTTKPERGVFEGYLTAKSPTLPVAGLLTLGLGILGLHEMSSEAFNAFSPSLLLGASIFFAGAKGNRSMNPAFAWSERLRAVFSHGSNKVDRLLILGRKMENEGYFREARERYETALNLANRHLEGIRFRDPENRGRAGEAHRAVGTAFFELAGFWDRRMAGRQMIVDFYHSALEHLDPLGRKSLWDVFLINNAKSRLQDLHLEEAQHWTSMGHPARAGHHFEAAGDFGTSAEARSNLWGKALRAYYQVEPLNLADLGRVMQKLDSGVS